MPLGLIGLLAGTLFFLGAVKSLSTSSNAPDPCSQVAGSAKARWRLGMGNPISGDLRWTQIGLSGCCQSLVAA
jgi:hypothetical protein